MTHYMNLFSSPFSKIAEGRKTIELRLYDEKRRKISVGDTVVFSCDSKNETIYAKVKQLHVFPDFEFLYKALPLTKCGYAENELAMAHYSDMEEYYSKERIQKYGACGIELCEVYVKKETALDTDAPDTTHSKPDTDILVEQLVDGIAGKETDNPSENDIEMRRRLSGRAWEYLMFMDDE